MASAAIPSLAPETLTKALLRSTEHFGLSRTELARVIGVSAASASRLGRSRFVEPESKEGELALIALRVFRGLDTLLGEAEACRDWLHSHNDHLDGVPARLMERVETLLRVAEYVDAMRAKS